MDNLTHLNHLLRSGWNLHSYVAYPGTVYEHTMVDIEKGALTYIGEGANLEEALQDLNFKVKGVVP